MSSFLNSSLTAGKNLISLIGQAESGNNSAYFGFKYVGASSASNFATIGLYGADNLLNILANGNVGIGTTSPQGKLIVSSAGAEGIEFFPAASSGVNATQHYNRSGGAYVRNRTIALDYTFNLSGAGTDAMILNSSSNLGIGTSSPTARLDVLSGTGTNGGLQVVVTGEAYGPNTTSSRSTIYDLSGTVVRITAANNSTATGALINFNAYNASNGATGAFAGAVAGSTGNGPAHFVIGRRTAAQTWAETFRITQNGGVSFGTSGSAVGTSGFVLKSNGDAAPTWVDPSTLASAGATNADNIRTIAQTGNASYFPAFVDSNNASNAYELVYTTSSFVINPQSGNVGIGVTSPSTRLDIADTARSGSTNISGTVLYATSNVTDTQFIAQFRHQNQSQGIGFSYNSIRQTGSNTNENISLSSRGTGNLFLRYNSTDTSVGTAGLTLLGTNGNVGIGTVTPSETLHISGGALRIDATSGEGGPYVYRAGGNAPDIRFHSSNGTIASPTASSSGGLLGQIHFQGYDGGTYRDFAAIFGVIDGAVSAGTLPSALVFFTGTTGQSEKLRITSAGGIAFGGSTNYGTSGQILRSNGNASPTWINQSSITVGTSTQVNTVLQTASASYFPTFVDSNNASATAESLYTTSSFVINPQSGNVGIGTTSPGSKLEIKYGVQSALTLPLTLNPGFYQAGSATGIGFLTDGNTTYTKGALVYTSNGTGWNIGDFQFLMRNDNNTNPVTLSDAVMTIYRNGNVGIGTSTPSGKLHLYQTAGGANQLTLDTNFASGNAYAINPFITSVSNGGFSIRDVTNSVERLVIQYSTGNVGIGTTAPDSKLHVEVGNATAYTPANTLVSGQTARISNTDATSGVSANLLFVAKGAGGGNGLGSISGVNTGVGSLAFTFGTRHSSSNVTERMRITSDGNVVIGATTTTNKFEVAGTAGQLFSVSDSFTGTIFAASDVSGIPSIEVLDTGLVKLAQYNGAVTIGTGTVSSSTAELSVYGMLYTSGPQGEIRASNEITAYFSSDRRLKENIKLIENPITILDQIRGVTFDWTDEHLARRGGEDGYFVRKHDIGVIAQEVQAVLPELVGTREDGYLAVKYEKMVALLIEAIKEQQKSIDMLKIELEKIKKQ